MTTPAPEIAEDALELPLANWRALRAAAHEDKMAEEKAATQARRDARRTAANDNVAPADGLPEALCYPPGAVGDIARFIVSASRFPSPPLALTAALALTGTLIGRRYKGPTNLRSNVYLVGLAESGMGKDITLRAPRMIAGVGPSGEAVAAKFLDADPASPEGLAMRMRSDPSILASIDEFGKWLAERTGRTAPAHKAGIISAMMRLTGAASGSWGGAEKSAGKQATIHAPCFSVHGVSTPSTFWAALGAGNISEGLLGRLIVINAGTRIPTKVRRPADSEEVPEGLQAYVKALAGNTGGFSGAFATGATPPPSVVSVPYGEGAEEEFEGFDDRIRAEAYSSDPTFRPVLMRVAENAGRLALIVAVGCDAAAPVITIEIQQWANDVAERSYRTMVRGAIDNIADSDRQASYLRVRGMIGRKESEGLSQGMLLSNLRGSIDGRTLDDILGQLFESGDCIFGEARAKSGQAIRRWWSTEHKPTGFTQTPRPKPGDPQMRR